VPKIETDSDRAIALIERRVQIHPQARHIGTKNSCPGLRLEMAVKTPKQYRAIVKRAADFA
jgi:hypothetical protein